MKLKTLLDIIAKLKQNSEITTKLEEREINYIREFIASTIREHEVELLKNLENGIEVDIEVIAWVMFHSESERRYIFNNLNSETFKNKNVEVIDNFEEIISSNKEIKPFETIPFKFYKYVSRYIKNRGIADNQANYAKRFLQNISYKYESYSQLTIRQYDYLEKIIKEYPDFFNNDYLIEEGFENECKIIAELTNEH
ncbi:hypothetical protein HN510_01845 [Candidatus Woesearchaeota archaeon]|jgi:hypothetical protein|nr:hypothetical protein [Candidatus Woesearchaeota archaeon]